MSKTQNVWRVPNVQCGPSVRPVSFKLNKRREFIRCGTPGLPTFRMYEAFNNYEVAVRGDNRVVIATTPAKAFAEAVKLFWGPQ